MTGPQVPTEKQNPYGLSDFETVQGLDYYYVDKTEYIPLLEKTGRFNFLIRPRRFGKSLLLSVLKSYYDINAHDHFDQLFEGTWIHDQPTPERNSYLILSLNFSTVDPDIDRVEASFDEHLKSTLEVFCDEYQEHLDESVIKRIRAQSSGVGKLRYLLASGQRLSHKIYLLIDEYDNFANTILSTQGKERYHTLTHGEGFFRYFFNLLKGGATGSGAGIARMLISGVSPVTMDDVTSGFNIGDNISLDLPFAEILGFNEQETRTILEHFALTVNRSTDELIALMRDWYGGYRFTFSEKNRTLLFNPDMVFYFIKKCMLSKDLPHTMIDNNIKMDYTKLRHLLLVQKQLNGNFALLNTITHDGGTFGAIKTSFPLEKMTHRENFVSLLFYFGLLSHHCRREGGSWLAIPNRTVLELIYGYLREGYEDIDAFRVDIFLLTELIRKMAYHGQWQPVFDYLSKEINNQTAIRDYIEGEKVIKTFLLAYLNMSDIFLVSTEQEHSKGYTDIVLEPFFVRYPDCPFSYLIELKYLPRGDYTENKLNQVIAQATKQLYHYGTDQTVIKRLGSTAIKKLLLVYCGWELIHKSEVHRDGENKEDR